MYAHLKTAILLASCLLHYYARSQNCEKRISGPHGTDLLEI